MQPPALGEVVHEIAAYPVFTQMECDPALPDIIPGKSNNNRNGLAEQVVEGEYLHGKRENHQCQAETYEGDKRKRKKLPKIIAARIMEIKVFVEEEVDHHPAQV